MSKKKPEIGGARFSKVFKLLKSQSELDFVDVLVDGDLPLFIDPFAMKQRNDRWSQQAVTTLSTYFQELIIRIRANDSVGAKVLLSQLKEPNEIRFGLSRIGPKGAGIGTGQAQQIFGALEESTAVKTGFLNALEDCELMVDGIARDKISDLTANVIRKHLIEYTQEQCALHNIEMQRVALPAFFEPDELQWRTDYGELPVYRGSIIILVPKAIARYHPVLDHIKYYNGFVLNYLQTEHIAAASSLVQTLKNGKQVVTKKSLKEKFRCTKDFLFGFSKSNPQVLQHYKQAMAKEAALPEDQDDDSNEIALAKALVVSLQEIPQGPDSAGRYHDLMVGAVEFLFYPHLIHPIKEQEIHEGRKRIDIRMDNAATTGIFEQLSSKFGLPCGFVSLECKNYSREIANPELDQIAGRFSPNRGKLGIILCRQFDNRSLFIKRCQDTLKDDRGLILPLDDERIVTLLECVARGARLQTENFLDQWFREIIFA